MNISDSAVERFWSKVEKSEEPGGCWLWFGTVGTNGYGNFWLDGTTVSAHRVAYEIAFGSIDPGLVVCHTCDVRTCVKPLHLFVGTYADNEHDKQSKGREARGARQGLARLSDADVLSLRAMATSTSTRALARRFGISQATARDVIHRRTWTHLP